MIQIQFLKSDEVHINGTKTEPAMLPVATEDQRPEIYINPFQFCQWKSLKKHFCSLCEPIELKKKVYI